MSDPVKTADNPPDGNAVHRIEEGAQRVKQATATTTATATIK